ncbi:MAG: dNTP triphosphohydrolase, partial [Planctomycetaceae bacterium]|nr:dNTP triphosphohydrolase [Planctomycetaceae bacterium]
MLQVEAWLPFLSDQRIGGTRPDASGGDSRASSGQTMATALARPRSEFHKDYDRIIFSSAFRRLSDKTQVVPMPDSDYTRRRLTHSLEVSCVGRSLATEVFCASGQTLPEPVTQGEVEAIVASACLAHDIGNPPFGHFGERAIQDWASQWAEQGGLGDLSHA